MINMNITGKAVTPCSLLLQDDIICSVTLLRLHTAHKRRRSHAICLFFWSTSNSEELILLKNMMSITFETFIWWATAVVLAVGRTSIDHKHRITSSHMVNLLCDKSLCVLIFAGDSSLWSTNGDCPWLYTTWWGKVVPEWQSFYSNQSPRLAPVTLSYIWPLRCTPEGNLGVGNMSLSDEISLLHKTARDLRSARVRYPFFAWQF